MDVLDTRQVLFLHEIVQTGSVRGAAEKLGLNPSSVSRGVADLEAALGMPLLVRHGRGSKVTETGAVIVEHFQGELKRRTELRARLEAMRAYEEGQVGVAMGEGYVATFMDEVYGRFRSDYPRLTLRVQAEGTTEIVRLVAEGEVQVGIAMNPPRHPRLRSVLAVRRPVRLVVPAGHPLMALGRPVRLGEVGGLPVAVKFGTYGIQRVIDGAGAEAGLRLDVVLRTSSTVALQRFVLGGAGVAFMSANDVVSMADPVGLGVLSVDHPAFDATETHVLVRTGAALGVPARRLLSLILADLRRRARA